MCAPLLSDDVIAEALARAKLLGCPPKGRRCAAWPMAVERALATLAPDGFCTIGGVEDVRSHGPLWRARFNVDSGEIRLERE